MTSYIKEARYPFWVVLLISLLLWCAIGWGCSQVVGAEDTWCEGKPPIYGTDC